MIVSLKDVTTPTWGPECAGIRLEPEEFDEGEFEEGWCYELINGVLVVSPSPLEMERDPNEELGCMLRNYREHHPQGKILDKTLPEHTIRSGKNRRRADRALWIGLGRVPRRKDMPSVVAEFVSRGKRNWRRDYEDKRDEYLKLGVQEYWVFNRFDRDLTDFTRQGRRIRKQVFAETDIYVTKLLPGFELPLAKLFALADEWEE